MSLVELIAQADERGLAASGLACLDRCVPLLGGDDELLRPLWASLAGTADWSTGLEVARGKLDGGVGDEADASGEDEAVVLARRMLDAAPGTPDTDGVREWADACSVASLQIHRILDPASGETPVDACREGSTEGVPPLVAAELRRQITVLEVVAGHGTAGLRRALEVSVEGRRVLRAVVSRRARGRN
jgi:hypothetical protein